MDADRGIDRVTKRDARSAFDLIHLLLVLAALVVPPAFGRSCRLDRPEVTRWHRRHVIATRGPPGTRTGPVLLATT